MRSITLADCLLLGTCVSAAAEVSGGISLPVINIGIAMPRYAHLQHRKASPPPRDERGAPPSNGNAGPEDRNARPEKAFASRETQPARSREQSGDKPGNPRSGAARPAKP